MNILITGASGFIGQHLLRACLDRGHQVSACVRDPNRLQRYFPEARAVKSDFSKDHESSIWLERVAGIDVVINAVGIIQQSGRNSFDALHTQAAVALFKACEMTNVGKVIQISALGADDSAFSQYHLSKKAADDYLSTLDLDWIILRPSIVYGPGAKSMRLFQALAALPCTPLLGTGEQLIQPIHIDDLSSAVLALVESDTIQPQRINVVGPSPVTVKTLYSLLKSWQGNTQASFINIPYQLALTAAQFGSMFNNTTVNPETLKMLAKGNTGDVYAFVELFGFTPQSMQQALYRRPPLQSELLDAKLYFLLPLLKFSLALLWIATGFISVFGYPVESSYTMLQQVGVPAFLMPITLYSAATLDIALGLALLISYQLRLALLLQILTVVIYTLIISISMPELWLHPFGPITKNIPLLVSTFVLLRLAK